MRQAAIAAIIVALFLLSAAPASSPWCEKPQADPRKWATEALNNGDAVFVGRVYSTKHVPQAAPEADETDKESVSSMAELLRRIEQGQNSDSYDYVVSFEVIRSWKDPALPIARMKVRLGPYHQAQKFRVGDTFLLIGREFDGSLYSLRNRCIDAILDEWSPPFKEALDDLNSSP